MIKVNNLQKYFNKNKSNEIHVINDASLEFPSRGLVCLLGPSGSGKTTLLNVIGGLDKVSSGEIIVGEDSIKRYNANKWDYIRNKNFGYIFQNYVLLPDLTVYQNLEFVLKMMNVNKEEIDKRIDYALNAVGMIKYKKRKPSQLSGGQQQRVAIARALVKSPNVVVADEPTGNLDEKNTTQIMSIIKKISKECLVILVTHERRLAEFYGDQIIELLDGKIVKIIRNVKKDDQLYQQDDRNIYLQEFNKSELENTNINVKYFYQDEKPNIELNIIFKDNTFYINSNQDNIKIKFIDSSSELKIVDSKKPTIKQEDIDDFDYHLPKLEINKKTKSAIRYIDTFKMAFNHLVNLRRRQKLFLLVFFLSAILIVIGFTSYVSSKHVDEKEFLFDNRNIVEVKGLKNYNDYLLLKEKLDIDYILGPKGYMKQNYLNLDIFKHAKSNTLYIPNHTLMPLDIIDESKLILGEMPDEKGEVLIDKYLVDYMLTQDQYKMSGAMFIDQFIGLSYYNEITSYEAKIVGIVDNNNPNIYMNLDEYRYLTITYLNGYQNFFTIQSLAKIDKYYDYNDYKYNNENAVLRDLDELELKENEIIVSTFHHNTQNATKVTFNNVEYNIVGFFESDFKQELQFIISEKSLEKLLYNSFINTPRAFPTVYTLNKTKTLDKLNDLKLEGIDVYDSTYQEHQTYNFSYVQYIFSIVVLVASLIFLFFIMRSSLISRIYEIGVYRALGVRKSNIYRLFTSEIILLTILTSLVGVIAVTMFINKANSMSPFDVIYFPWYVSVISTTFIFGCNLFVGLIPIRNLLRLTPSAILSKYDI